MAEPVPIALAKGSNAGRYPQLGTARLLNCYIEELGEQGKSPFSVFAIDGLIEWGTLPSFDGGVRGMLALDTELLTVAGRQLYSSSAAGGIAALVGGIPADGIVTMAANRNSPRDVAIVVNGSYWLYTGGVLTTGADPDLPSPIAVTEISGYFVFAIADGRFYIAGPDSTNVDALDFASAEASADQNVMVATRGRELVIFGTNSTEFWNESGAADFPFARVQSIDVGCYAPASVANVMVLKAGVPASDTLVWAASDHKGAYAAVVLLDGYSAVPISTPEIDRLIRAEPNPDNIRAFSWTDGGSHSFYCITGTAFSKVWDTKSGYWHDRETRGLARWRPSEHATFARLHLFGDADSGILYRSSPDIVDDAGERIRMEMILPNIHMFPKRFKVRALHIDVVTGVGLNTLDDDADPKLMISVSHDAGVSWGAERQVSLGRMSQRHVRIKQRTFGNFGHNGMTVRLACTAKVVKAIQNAAIEADPLTA